MQGPSRGRAKRPQKSSVSHGRAGSITNGKRTMLWFWSMRGHQPQRQPTLQGDLHPREVATWESQYLVIHKRAKPAVLIYNPEVLPLKCMGGWGRGPSCFLLSPGPTPPLQMVASAGLPQTTGEALCVEELHRWDGHPLAPQLLSPWLVSKSRNWAESPDLLAYKPEQSPALATAIHGRWGER